MGLSVAGEMPSAEMWKSNQIAARAVYGHGKWSFVVLLVVVLALYWVLIEALDDLTWTYEHPALSAISTVALGIALVTGAVFLLNRRLKAAAQRRGARASFPLTFSIEDRGLKLTTSLSESVTFWGSFGEVTHNASYWILIVERSAFLLPRRFFASPAEEKAFLGAMWERLGDDVRARSSKAAQFLA